VYAGNCRWLSLRKRCSTFREQNDAPLHASMQSSQERTRLLYRVTGSIDYSYTLPLLNNARSGLFARFLLILLISKLCPFSSFVT